MDNPTRFRKLPADIGTVNNTSVERLRPELRASAEAVRKHIRGGFLAAGRELRRAREKCNHGEWTPYLGAVGISRSGAFEVMKAAAAVDSGTVPARPVVAGRACPAPKSSPVEHFPNVRLLPDRPGDGLGCGGCGGRTAATSRGKGLVHRRVRSPCDDGRACPSDGPCAVAAVVRGQSV